MNVLKSSQIGVFFLFIWFLSPPQDLSAQHIHGVVNEKGEKSPIEGAEIRVAGTFLGAISDSSGYFNISGLSSGTYQLSCYLEGYETETREVYLGSDAPTRLAIQLSPLSIQLPEEIVITARRSKENVWAIPEAMSVMSQMELQERNPRSLPEGMMSVPGVWMQKTNHGGGSAFLRGLTGNQTLLLIDGIRINNSTYRYGPNQYLNTIDPFSLGRIEVIRGGGAVQYGSDALGGVINLLTPEPEFSPDKLEMDIQLQAKYMSADMEKTLRGTWQFRSSRLALRMGLSYKDFGDLLAGGELGIQAPSSYREVDGDFKAVLAFGARQRLTLAWQRVDQREVGRYDQVAQRGYQVYQFDPQQRQLAYLRWERVGEGRWVKSLRMTISGQYSNEQRTKQREGSQIQKQEQDEVSTLGVSIEHAAQPTKNWRIQSGIDFYNDQIASIAYNFDSEDSSQQILRGLYPDGASSTNASAYSLHTYHVNWLTLKGGLRYNLIQLNAFDPLFGGLDLQPQALVGHLASTAHIGKFHHITASIQSGFRAPNINDLSSFGSFDSGIEVPSQELSPERTLTGELTYKVNAPRFSGSLTLYRTRLFDLIARVPGTFNGSSTYEGEDVYQKANVELATIQGVEVQMGTKLNEVLATYASMTYTYGATVEDNPAPLRRIPPLFGLVGLSYGNGQGLGGRIDYRFAGKQDRLSSGDISDHRIADGGTPAWQVLDAYFSYHWKMIEGRIGIQNLFNEAYRMHGSGVDGVGRSIWIAIQLNI